MLPIVDSLFNRLSHDILQFTVGRHKRLRASAGLPVRIPGGADAVFHVCFYKLTPVAPCSLASRAYELQEASRPDMVSVTNIRGWS